MPESTVLKSKNTKSDVSNSRVSESVIQTSEASESETQNSKMQNSKMSDSEMQDSMVSESETIPETGVDGVPVPDTILLQTPVDTAAAIRDQVLEAAKRVEEELLQQQKIDQIMAQLKEVMDAQEEALEAQISLRADDPAGWKENGQTAETEETETETEAETETELETETETELPEETETEFHPVEMGASLPNTGGSLDWLEEETETENLAGSSTESGDSASPETEGGEQTPATEENGEVDDSVMYSRHGVFSVPKVDGLNEARINLYDYRMLREYPLSRLPKDLHILYRQLKDQVEAYSGTWSVYVQNLTTGQALVVNDIPMRSASVMKLFIMETVYEAFDRGDLPRNEDTVYLLRSMIINSSNESSNRLLSLLGDGDIATGIERVNEFIRLRGFSDGTTCYNGFQDPAASVHPDHPNAIMAKDVGLLLSRVYNRTFLSRKVCNEIEQMMLEQGTRYKIPRGLPDGVECGNKSGETDTIANDAAVIYGPTTDYILVVLSNDWGSEDTANAQVAEVSRTVYSFFENS